MSAMLPRAIPKGTRILCEKSIIFTPQYVTGPQLQKPICQQVEALNKHQQEAFLTLHNIHPFNDPAEQYLGMAQTHCFQILTDGIDGGVFLEASLIDHACNNNSQRSWDERIKKHAVRALNRKEIQEALLAKFGFECSCRLCSLPLKQGQESDQRLKKVHHLERLISQTLRWIDQHAQLYDEQGPGDAILSWVFFNAAQIAIANGDLARGRIFAEMALTRWRTSYGSDCKSVGQYGDVAKDLSKLHLHGMSKNWQTALDDVPYGLEPGEFEDWLWRRDKSKVPQSPIQPANLRIRAIFPGFDGLPSDNFTDLESHKIRHWCFLAEIVDVIDVLLRLQFDIRDIDGNTVPLYFYTDKRGRDKELDNRLVKNGHTVAIFYVRRHAFAYDKPGIHHEDPKLMKASLPRPAAQLDRIC
ncbi:SET domain-containing protein 5 [Calycina marina]|uniref:SET domain-containing protein 5 n=1 Tax=Calycina marina TaxID=1763456 RepID=A0A9P7YXD8_9HELO|nr:SET domain-containing protein 5 [Calycina marina]